MYDKGLNVNKTVYMSIYFEIKNSYSDNNII